MEVVSWIFRGCRLWYWYLDIHDLPMVGYPTSGVFLGLILAAVNRFMVSGT